VLNRRCREMEMKKMEVKMTTRFFYAFTGLLAMSSLAWPQSGPEGTWVGEAAFGAGGSRTVTLVLSVDGKDVTGTFQEDDRPEEKISEGSVDGNMVSFTRNLDLGGRSFPLGCTGEVDGDMLTLNMSPGSAFEIPPLVLTRQ